MNLVSFGKTLCDPNVIVGTEMVRALPSPSSSETVNDSSEVSIGKIGDCRCELEITGARSLAKSAAMRRGRAFDVVGRSLLGRRGPLSDATAGALSKWNACPSSGFGAG